MEVFSLQRHCEASEAICAIILDLFEIMRTDCLVPRNDAKFYSLR